MPLENLYEPLWEAVFTESLPPNSMYCGTLTALAGSLTATTTFGGILAVLAEPL